MQISDNKEPTSMPIQNSPNSPSHLQQSPDESEASTTTAREKLLQLHPVNPPGDHSSSESAEESAVRSKSDDPTAVAASSTAPDKAASEDDTCSHNSNTTGTAETAPAAGPREKLKRHRAEVSGRVWIPDVWEQESFLNGWIDDCAAFDAALVSRGINARASLMEEGR